jgi:hypothetical protein
LLTGLLVFHRSVLLYIGPAQAGPSHRRRQDARPAGPRCVPGGIPPRPRLAESSDGRRASHDDARRGRGHHGVLPDRGATGIESRGRLPSNSKRSTTVNSMLSALYKLEQHHPGRVHGRRRDCPTGVPCCTDRPHGTRPIPLADARAVESWGRFPGSRPGDYDNGPVATSLPRTITVPGPGSGPSSLGRLAHPSGSRITGRHRATMRHERRRSRRPATPESFGSRPAHDTLVSSGAIQTEILPTPRTRRVRLLADGRLERD